MNRLLRQQASEYFTSAGNVDPNLINLLQMISETYDFFENKLNTINEEREQLTKTSEASKQRYALASNVKPFGYAQLVPAWFHSQDAQTGNSANLSR